MSLTVDKCYNISRPQTISDHTIVVIDGPTYFVFVNRAGGISD